MGWKDLVLLCELAGEAAELRWKTPKKERKRWRERKKREQREMATEMWESGGESEEKEARKLSGGGAGGEHKN